jgi:Domain of unknown function (DUF4265)
VKREQIVVDLPSGEPATAELLWARRLRDGAYELENVPVWAYGLAYQDVIHAETGDDGRKHFTKLVQKSGLLTVHAAGPDANKEVFESLLQELEVNAVATERYTRSYAAFAMEPQAFSKMERRIDGLERTEPIFVEIANDDSV